MGEGDVARRGQMWENFQRKLWKSRARGEWWERGIVMSFSPEVTGVRWLEVQS